jgi:hypothetical protein
MVRFLCSAVLFWVFLFKSTIFRQMARMIEMEAQTFFFPFFSLFGTYLICLIQSLWSACVRKVENFCDVVYIFHQNQKIVFFNCSSSFGEFVAHIFLKMKHFLASSRVEASNNFLVNTIW